MAEIQDLNSEDVGEIEAVEQQKQQSQTQDEQPKIDLPEKYRGKSVEDVVRMHQEAEKLIDRQSREVGEVRKLADELIKSQLTPKAEVEKPKEVDFFSDPQEAVRQQIENHPKIRAAEQYAVEARKAQASQALAQKHPDAQQIVQDAEFQKWVTGSKVRQQLFAQADQYDIDAADELFSTFKELKGIRAKANDAVESAARDQSLRSASVDSGGSGEGGRKVFRRADLIRLRMRDPNKYEAMQDEIMAAYQEGRVK